MFANLVNVLVSHEILFGIIILNVYNYDFFLNI